MEALIIDPSYIGQMSDEQLERFCAAHDNLRIERNADQKLILMSPTFGITGKYNSEILRQLANWNSEHNLGVVFDSNTGFFLPNQAMRAPDAAWLSHQTLLKAGTDALNHFLRVMPDFFIELRSSTDHLPQLQNKMVEWQQNGAGLGWLIDPIDQRCYTYLNGMCIATQGWDRALQGQGLVSSFVLNLALLRR